MNKYYLRTVHTRLRNGPEAMRELSLFLSIEYKIRTESAIGHILEFVRNGYLIYDSSGRITLAPVVNAKSDEDPTWNSYDSPLKSNCWSCDKEYQKKVIPGTVTVFFEC